MTPTELVKMSPKGQLVVPQEIREKEHFEIGDRFIPIPIQEGIIFKKIKIPNIKMEFEKISKEIEEHFKKKNISSKEVSEAITWARKK